MNAQPKISATLLANNDVSNVLEFLKSKNETINENQNIVKTYFDGHDVVLVLYDGTEQKNTMLLTFKDFTKNEDTLIELNTIFRESTRDMNITNVIKMARQATDEIIGMIPTFQAYFGEQLVSTPAVRINTPNYFASQETSIAA